MFDRQKLFDTAVRGIVAQGGPALNVNYCVYRAPNGNKCAIGHSIPDADYVRLMEYNTPNLNGDLGAKLIAKAIGCENDDDARFARELQRKTHDNAAHMDGDFMPIFLRLAREFAVVHNLSTEVLDNVRPTESL